jgi:hypothetical protein
MHGHLRSTYSPKFIFYMPTAPIARHRLRNVLSAHTSHLLYAPIDESHRDVSAFMNPAFCVYIDSG